MTPTIQKLTIRGKKLLHTLAADPRVHIYARGGAYFLSGFLLSAASLQNAALPLAMGFTCACDHWSAVLAALGSAHGYLLFWETAGLQGLFWVTAALLISLLLRARHLATPPLLAALCALVVSAGGVLFQSWLGDRTAVDVYLLRILCGCGSVWLFYCRLTRRTPIVLWLCRGVAVLALAQLSLFPGLSLGFVAAGALAVAGAFPSVALAGLALDLSGICPVSMTAALCLSYLPRFLPQLPRWLRPMLPVMGCLALMQLTSTLSLTPLMGLALGGIGGLFAPAPVSQPSRRGETGVAQVRLELAASVLSQTEQLLLEVPQPPVDEDALVEKAAAEACHGCPCRSNCKDMRRVSQLPGAVLHKPLLHTEELPILCRKSGRLLAHLHRAQEQLRTIRADRQRQQEYRFAVTQQYRFLAEYLQELSDGLARRLPPAAPLFSPQVQVYANRPREDNGDRCAMFAGTQGKYYVLLCDGMGTGIGAVQEGKTAARLLQQLLTAGYPARHALQSLNSICALRSRAGIVTIELLEIALDTGRALLYKWGSPPSYLVTPYGAEKLGTAGPPPGLSVAECRETVFGLSLRRGEVLLLVSDGISQEEALRESLASAFAAPGELARKLLDQGQLSSGDDATVVTVSLGRAEQS